MTRPPNSTESDLLADLNGEDLACLGMHWADWHPSFDYDGYIADLNAAEQAAAASAPPQRARQRNPRKPSIRSLVKQAEQATGKAVTSITLPDGTKLDLGAPGAAEPKDPWPLDEFRTKETKQ